MQRKGAGVTPCPSPLGPFNQRLLAVGTPTAIRSIKIPSYIKADTIDGETDKGFRVPGVNNLEINAHNFEGKKRARIPALILCFAFPLISQFALEREEGKRER